jgi:hypothetical protein
MSAVTAAAGMRLIFYGKGREFSTNKQADMEVAMLCLHLLQISR